MTAPTPGPADPVVGIDLGTTFSAVAHVNGTGTAVIIPNREGRNITPSAVLIDGDRFVVGEQAIRQATARPDDVARFVKRQMGTPGFQFQGYTPEVLSAEILKKLVADASAALNATIQRVVITVPAYFTGAQRELTRQAGELAGLTVLELRDEPVAAAIHFGIRGLKDGESVLVCDLGGGTYDATVLAMKGAVLSPLGTSGSRELGGVDWTARMTELLAELLRPITGLDLLDDAADPVERARLEELAEETKCLLGGQPEVTVRWSHAGGTATVTVRRDEYDARCAGLMSQVLDKTAEAVAKSRLPMASVTHVLLVGGSSRLVMFAEGIAALTGKKPRRSRNPDEAIALGAALIADWYATGGVGSEIMVGPFTVETTASHALGTRVANAKLEIITDTLIPENAPLPAVFEKEYTLAPDQHTFQVPVVELDQFGTIQSWHANYRFYGVTKRKTPSRIRVRFAVDAHAKVPDVTATDVTDKANAKSLDREVMPYSDPIIVDGGDGGDGAAPTTVVLAVDCSGSMSGLKIEEARKALREIAAKYLTPGSARSLAVVNFGGDYDIYPARVLVPPTQSLADIAAAATRLVTGGGTPMDAGFQRIREILEVAPPGKRLAVILTDGMPDNPTAAADLARTLKAQGIVIGTVPIGSDANRDFLRDIGDLESSIPVGNDGGGMSSCVLDILSNA